MFGKKPIPVPLYDVQFNPSYDVAVAFVRGNDENYDGYIENTRIFIKRVIDHYLDQSDIAAITTAMQLDSTDVIDKVVKKSEHMVECTLSQYDVPVSGVIEYDNEIMFLDQVDCISKKKVTVNDLLSSVYKSVDHRKDMKRFIHFSYFGTDNMFGPHTYQVLEDRAAAFRTLEVKLTDWAERHVCVDPLTGKKRKNVETTYHERTVRKMIRMLVTEYLYPEKILKTAMRPFQHHRIDVDPSQINDPGITQLTLRTANKSTTIFCKDEEVGDYIDVVKKFKGMNDHE